jgi:hypothetical protein
MQTRRSWSGIAIREPSGWTVLVDGTPWLLAASYVIPDDDDVPLDALIADALAWRGGLTVSPAALTITPAPLLGGCRWAVRHPAPRPRRHKPGNA